jgi:hypothetical protein
MTTKPTLLLLILFVCLESLVSYQCFGINSNDNTICSSNGKCLSSDLCSCFSGFNGTKCENKHESLNCLVNQNSLDKTNFYPFLNFSSFENGNLKLKIYSPLVKERYDTKIYIQNSTSPCQYPGQYAKNILINTTPCYNSFEFNIPWVSVGLNCGWKKTETSTRTIFEGKIFIKLQEKAGTIRNIPIMRDLSSAISLRIEFNKVTNVNKFSVQ